MVTQSTPTTCLLLLFLLLLSISSIATSSDPSEGDAVSFVDAGAYVKMDGFSTVPKAGWTGGSLSFRVMTSSQMAILFYSSGEGNKTKQFVAVEVLNGKTSLSVNDGNGVVVLQSDVIVNDGFWHEVLVVFSPGYLEVTVDGKQRTLQPKPGTKPFDLKNELFVGGIDARQEFVALQQGLNTILSEGPESSLVGCIKEVRVNRKPISSKEFKGSKGVKFKGCYWDFVCLLQDPCLEDAECFQEGLNGFHCLCDHDICTRPNFNKSSATSYNLGHQVVHIDPRTSFPTTWTPKTSTTSTSTIANVATSEVSPGSTATPSPPTVMDIVRPNLTYLSIVITREQVIIGAYMVTVVFVLILVGVLIREFYLLGRGRRKGNKTRDGDIGGAGGGGGPKSTGTISARCESSSHASHSPCLELELDQGPPSTVSNLESNFGGSIDSRQPLTGALLGVSSIYSRIEREREKARRESLILYPLPPPSLYFNEREEEEEEEESAPSTGSRCCVYNRSLLHSKAMTTSTLRGGSDSHQPRFQDCVVSTLGRRPKSGQQHLHQHQHPSSSLHLPLTRMDPLKVLERHPCSDGNSSSTGSGTPLPPLQRLPWYRSCEDLPSPPSSSSSFCPHHHPSIPENKRKSRCFDCNNTSSNILSIDRSNGISRYHQTPTFETFSPPSPLPPPRNPHYWI